MRKKSGPNYIRGNTKRCTGPLHNGEDVSLDKFWKLKTGRMAGKPMARCIDCTRLQKYGHTLTGYIEVHRVRFIFEEMERRVGRAEAARRIGASINFYIRLHKKEHKYIQ